MEILEIDAQYRVAATKADLNGNSNGKLDEDELMDFAKEAAKGGNRSNMEKIIDSFGEQTDEIKTFMTKIKDLETIEKQLKEAEKRFEGLKEQERRTKFQTSDVVIDGVIGSAFGAIAGGVLAGVTKGAFFGGPVGAVAGAAIGLGIGLYNGYSDAIDSHEKRMERFDDKYGQDYRSYKEIIPKLKEIIAKKKQEIGL